MLYHQRNIEKVCTFAKFEFRAGFFNSNLLTDVIISFPPKMIDRLKESKEAQARAKVLSDRIQMIKNDTAVPFEEHEHLMKEYYLAKQRDENLSIEAFKKLQNGSKK